MTTADHFPTPTYASSGVDEALEQSVFGQVMRPWLSKTAVRSTLVSSITGLSSGYFATLLHLPPGPPLAITTDGVGTKILLAREAGRYEGIGYDVVANNVNDIICVGAEPLALLDYLATDRIERDVLEQLAKGLYHGATEAGISIPGGEIAQVGAMLADPGVAGPMLDLVGTALGALPKGDGPGGWREPLDGSKVRPGDAVLGIASSGLHSNGYSLARTVLMRTHGEDLDVPFPGADRSLIDALLEPTAIYVRAVKALWESGISPRGLVHISGGGLLNLGRLAANVSYVIDALPAPQPIFGHIQEASNLPNETMFETFNMGVGFCVVIEEDRVGDALVAIRDSGHAVSRIGYVTGELGQHVTVPSARIKGRDDNFHRLAVQ